MMASDDLRDILEVSRSNLSDLVSFRTENR